MLKFNHLIHSITINEALLILSSLTLWMRRSIAGIRAETKLHRNSHTKVGRRELMLFANSVVHRNAPSYIRLGWWENTLIVLVRMKFQFIVPIPQKQSSPWTLVFRISVNRTLNILYCAQCTYVHMYMYRRINVDECVTTSKYSKHRGQRNYINCSPLPVSIECYDHCVHMYNSLIDSSSFHKLWTFVRETIYGEYTIRLT